MFFHHIVLHMFRPYMQAAKQRDDSAALFTPTGPQALFAASTKKLKRLMIEHNGHHESAVWNIAWTCRWTSILDFYRQRLGQAESVSPSTKSGGFTVP